MRKRKLRNILFQSLAHSRFTKEIIYIFLEI